MTKFYSFGQSAPAHVDSVETAEGGLTVSAEFYFDYTIDREVMGRYGIYGVKRPLAVAFRACEFTGFELGNANCFVWPEAQYPNSIELPDLVLLVVSGDFMSDDFSLGKMKDLTISERVYNLLLERDPYTERSSRELQSNGRPVPFSL